MRALTAVRDYGMLHELIDRLEPNQAEELREHTMRLVTSTPVPPGAAWWPCSEGSEVSSPSREPAAIPLMGDR